MVGYVVSNKQEEQNNKLLIIVSNNNYLGFRDSQGSDFSTEEYHFSDNASEIAEIINRKYGSKDSKAIIIKMINTKTQDKILLGFNYRSTWAKFSLMSYKPSTGEVKRIERDVLTVNFPISGNKLKEMTDEISASFYVFKENIEEKIQIENNNIKTVKNIQKEDVSSISFSILSGLAFSLAYNL